MTAVSRGGAWLEYVQPPDGAGMHGILVRPKMGLELDRHRIAVSKFDQYSVRLLEWCIANRTSALIGHPDPLNVLGALVPAAAHVARLVSSGTADLRVAVVTRDARIRSVYRRLSVGDASLSEVVPAIVVSRDGVTSRLGRTDVKGATYFMRSCADVRLVQRLDLIVVDAPATDMAALPDNVPCLYLARDPGDYEIVRLAQRLPTFCWSTEDVADVENLIAYDGFELRHGLDRLENIKRGLNVLVEPVIAPDAAENASLFWLDVGSLITASRDSHIGTQLARDAFSLFQELIALSVPFDLYERMYGSVERRVKAIDDAAGFLRGECRELYVPTVALELEHLANSLRADPPKRKALLRLLEPLCAMGEVTILTRDTAGAEMVGEYIAGNERFRDRVRVLPFGGLAGADSCQSAILLGMAPSYARHVYFSGLAREVYVLAYAAGAAEFHGGATEAELVVRTVAQRRQYSTWLSRPAAKASCWARVRGIAMDVNDENPRPPRVAVPETEDSLPAVSAADVPPALWGQLADLRDLEAISAERAAGLADSAPGDRTTEAMRLRFSDGRWVLVGREDEVSVLRSSLRSVELVPVSRIAVGDVLVLIDGKARKDVLTKVLEVGSDVPELAVSAAWMHPWKAALASARHKFRTYTALHSALTVIGCTVQAQTVRLWTVGVTIGPVDPENIRRIGVVADEHRLVENYRRIYAAMELFRNAHAVLGRRIGDMARFYGTAAVAGRVDADEILDQRSGLTVADFRDCMEIMEISAVEPCGVVPRAVLDRIQTQHEDEQ